MPQGAFALLP